MNNGKPKEDPAELLTGFGCAAWAMAVMVALPALVLGTIRLFGGG